jgi:hypothetical protein
MPIKVLRNMYEVTDTKMHHRGRGAHCPPSVEQMLAREQTWMARPDKSRLHPKAFCVR